MEIQKSKALEQLENYLSVKDIAFSSSEKEKFFIMLNRLIESQNGSDNVMISDYVIDTIIRTVKADMHTENLH